MKVEVSQYLINLHARLRDCGEGDLQAIDTGNLRAILYSPRDGRELVNVIHFRGPFITSNSLFAEDRAHVKLNSENFSAIFVYNLKKIEFENGYGNNLVGSPNNLVLAPRVVVPLLPDFGFKKGTRLLFYDR